MRDAAFLRDRLVRLHGRGYRAYKEIRGDYAFPAFTLCIDHVQGDPFATPSRVRALLPAAEARLPAEALAGASRRWGAAALLARTFAARARAASRRIGTGHGGEIRVEAPGQEVYPQTAVQVAPDGAVEARFTVGLPAAGRRVLGREAGDLLCERLPALIREGLCADAHETAAIVAHAEANEDAEALRAALAGRDLVAFVADGAILPRRSGIDDRPLGEGAVPFRSPDGLRVSVELPNRGSVSGMGIRRGVTLIVGGGYHGKSTLLQALERGVWNHRPGDGRELVVCEADAVKIRAEDGRAVTGVDISPFIADLPGGRSTEFFTTDNASGSTSQAAAIQEAREAGATALLLDEDTSATNFLIRDRRMQALVPKEREPITPLIDQVRALHERHGVSTVLVLGGSGDYLDVADTVLSMESYVPVDRTGEARRIAAAHPTGRAAEAAVPLGPPPGRVPEPGCIGRGRRGRDLEAKIRGLHTIQLGENTLDLAAVEPIVSAAQTRAIGRALAYVQEHLLAGGSSIPEILDALFSSLGAEGLDLLDGRKVGDLAAVRRHEVAAALNRLRSLRVRAAGPEVGTV